MADVANGKPRNLIVPSRRAAFAERIKSLRETAGLTQTELANLIKTPLTSVLREVDRLADAGLITERRVGRARLLQANPRSRYTRPRRRATRRRVATFLSAQPFIRGVR